MGLLTPGMKFLRVDFTYSLLPQRQVDVTLFAKDENKMRVFPNDKAAKTFIDNHTDPMKIIQIPVGIPWFFGNFIQIMNDVTSIYDALHKYPEKSEVDTTRADLGKPSISLAQYAASL